VLKIRLKRCGRKSKPFYRIVVVDSRVKRDGAVKEQIGYYDPIKLQTFIRYNRLMYHVTKGTQLTTGVFKILQVKTKK
jgi:small subunit ribosomal protein S16